MAQVTFLSDLHMCSETLIYCAEYFLIPAPKITKPIFEKKFILLKGGFQKCMLLPT